MAITDPNIDADDVRKPEAPPPKEVMYYQYEALPSNQCFRLLRLSARASGEIQCSLRTFDIKSDTLTQYRAVSYVWGEDVEETDVLVRGPDSSLRSLPVPNNVRTLLSCVRGAEPCWLWIDAICINQQSDEERGNQVKLMGEIYSKSSAVLAWLGPDHQAIDHAFEFMRRASSDGITQPSMEAHCNTPTPRAGIYMWKRWVCTDMSEWEYYWDCVVEFSKLAYWTRKWIIQEIIKPPTVMFHSGSSQLVMTVAESFFGQLNENSHSYVRNYDDSISRLDSYEAEETDRYRNWEAKVIRLMLGSSSMAILARHRLDRRIGRTYPLSLHELLFNYDRHRCKDPSDHVYALFNLVGEHRHNLEVDYTQTPAERCRAVVQFMQKHDGLPQPEVMSVTTSLLTKLGVTNEVGVRGTLQRDIEREAEFVTVKIFDRGVVRLATQSTEILERRKDIPALCVMPRWGLRNVTGHWDVQTKASNFPNAFVADDCVVSPKDLTCFNICDTEVFGLATALIQDGDQIWQAQETNLAFVVRKILLDEKVCPRNSGVEIESQCSEIVGRAIIFPNAKANMFDRLQGSTLWATIFEGHEIDLKPADLFDLAFWANSMGPAASPFST